MNLLFGLFFIITGILYIVAPKKTSLFTQKWKYKDEEPCEVNITLTVISGIFVIIVGIYMLFR